MKQTEFIDYFVQNVAIYKEGNKYGLISLDLEVLESAKHEEIKLTQQSENVAVFETRTIDDMSHQYCNEEKHILHLSYNNTIEVSAGKIVSKKSGERKLVRNDLIDIPPLEIIMRYKWGGSTPQDLLKEIEDEAHSTGYSKEKILSIRSKFYDKESLIKADSQLYDIIKQHTNDYMSQHPEYKKHFRTYENVFLHLPDVINTRPSGRKPGMYSHSKGFVAFATE